MVLFSPDSCQPKLVANLNSILVLLYRLDDGIFFVPISLKHYHDLVVAIRSIIRFGKSLGFKVYDTEI